MTMTKFEDDFLTIQEFKKIHQNMHNSSFPWFYNSSVAEPDKDDGIYFNHCFYFDNQVRSDYFEFLEPVLKKLKVKSLMTVKANLYPQTKELIKHGLHRDQDFNCKSALLMMNSCDGYTYLKEIDSKIESVANRVVHFNSYIPHHSTTTTNEKVRLTININYF